MISHSQYGYSSFFACLLSISYIMWKLSAFASLSNGLIKTLTGHCFCLIFLFKCLIVLLWTSINVISISVWLLSLMEGAQVVFVPAQNMVSLPDLVEGGSVDFLHVKLGRIIF